MQSKEAAPFAKTVGAGQPDPTIPLHFEFQGYIQHAFQSHAVRAPQAPALVSREQTCTYGELAEISNRIAGYLRAAGVGRGNSVALLSDRNPALIYAMLGVLESGAAFFVLDAAYPAARIVECMSLASPSCLLICGDVALPEELRHAPGSLLSKHVPVDKAECLSAFSACAKAPAPEFQDDCDAYFGFTSGSTGKPKAIVTTHAPLVHFVDWHARTHGLTAADRFSLLSGLSHDPVLRDIFTPLSVGASLHIPEQALVFDPYRLANWLHDQAITVIHLTPALGQIIFAGAASGKSLKDIRYFFWGGDVLGAKLARGLRGVATNAQQVNFYGATETPQAMSSFNMDPNDEREVYPLGRGIADVQLLVVTESSRLAELGEVGEILIRTPYLSKGYLGDPERTQAVFVSNPFTNQPADRCYRTGDLGVYLPDGNVAFSGRFDHQVKIRGYRVELDEVRAKIEQQPGIARALVLARDLGRAAKVLVAYYTCEVNHEVSSTQIQRALRGLVPAYMIPAYIVGLASFPLLPNGKINLQALPDPSKDSDPQGAADSEPANERERQLIRIWSELLGVASVGVNESFLDLGGDSLSMIGVLVRMRQLGIVEGVARGVVQGKTIAEIVREEQGETSSTNVTLLSGPARTSLLVNCLRGILVSIVVAGHWFPGLLKRLPPSLSALQTVLDPVFNLATPGFAFVFGITLGFYYYPKYPEQRGRLRHMLNFGLCLLGVSLLIEGLLRISVLAVEGQSLTAHLIWVSFFGSLLYYFLALATAPIWFRVIGRFQPDWLASLGLMGVCYLLHRGCEAWLLAREQTGFLQLCRLILVAKYAYFNMSIGALGGASLGIYLFRRPNNPHLTAHLFLGAVVLLATGFTILRVDRGDFAALADGDDMGLWRWPVYGGTILLLASCLTVLINRYAQLPPPFRTALNLAGILGQCSLLVYVLHGVVLQAKQLLVAAGVSESVSLAVPLLAFLGLCYFVMSKMYRIFYGGLGS